MRRHGAPQTQTNRRSQAGEPAPSAVLGPGHLTGTGQAIASTDPSNVLFIALVRAPGRQAARTVASAATEQHAYDARQLRPVKQAGNES